MDIKGEIDINTALVGWFNIPLTSMERSSRQKINKETATLQHTRSNGFNWYLQSNLPQTNRMWCRSRHTGAVCCSSNGQIHTDYRNSVEKRGPERARPLPGHAFVAFLGTLHGGWSWFTMHRFTVGDYLLQITKERMLLITSKRRMLQIKGESGWTGYIPYLGGLAQTLGS